MEAASHVDAGKSKENRAGRYVLQPTGYRAFLPAPLPPPSIPRRERSALERFFFKRHRAEHYERLQAACDAGDWQGWLDSFLRGVAAVSREANHTAAAILKMREEYRNRITEKLGRAVGNGRRIMGKLFDHPIVTVATVRTWLDVTPAGANQLVNRLVDAGVLRAITGYARNRRFCFDPYLRLFEEPEEGRP